MTFIGKYAILISVIITNIKIDNNNQKEKERLTMKKFVCTVCGYVHEGDAAPAECPVCHAPAEKFKEQVKTSGKNF